jgi:hypothetical protein
MKRVVIASKCSSKRPVRAAEEGDTRVEDLSSTLKDDFDYALDGFDKLVRSGKVAEALSIMSTLSDAINVAIEDSASQITE